MFPHRAARAVLALAALAFSACSDSPSAPSEGANTPVSLAIADPGVVRDGDVVQLSAVARNAAGQAVAARIEWSVVDPTVASVSTSGLLTAHREGTTDVVALIVGLTPGGLIQQRRALSVVLHPATAIEVASSAIEVPLNTVGTVAVTLRGLDGRVLQGRPLTWTSEDPAVAQVDASGRVQALRPGTTIVRVRYGTLSAAIQVRVPAPAPITTSWDIVAVNGRAVPAVIEDAEIMLPGGPVREIARIEGGTVITGGATYSVSLPVVTVRRTELQGNVIERVVGRATVRDRGTVMYDWFTGEGRWSSTDVGGLTHQVLIIDGFVTLQFREPGTSTVWQLRLRERR